MIYIALIYSFIFMIFFILVQFVPYYIVNSKIYKYGLVILISMFSYIAYNYIPLKTDDLYRYYALIDEMRTKPIEWGLFSSIYTYEPVSNFLFLCVAKMTKNNAIYQTIAILLIYGLFFLNIKKLTKFKLNKETNLYFITFLSFTLFLYAISGTRNTLAALLFSYGLFNENNKITKKSLLFYILSVGTHMGLLPIVMIRLLCNFLPRRKFNFLHLVLFFLPVTLSILLNLLSNLQSEYVRRIIWKVQVYIYNRYQQGFGIKQIIAVLSEGDIRYVLAMLGLCLLLLIMYIVEANNKSTYFKFMGYLIFLTLGCLISPVMFERYMRVVCACMLPMFIELKKQRWIAKKLVMYGIAILDIGMLSYQTVMFLSHFNTWFM